MNTKETNNTELLMNFYNQNKKDLINFYNKTNDLEILESTLNNINNSIIEYDVIKELKNIIKNRIYELKSKNIENVIDEIKQNNSNLKNFNIVETSKDINNKDFYGFRNNATYLKVTDEDNTKLYEIENNNIDQVKEILENENNNNNNLQTKDLLEKLKPFLNELEQIEMDYKTNLDKDTLIEELNNINEMDVKQVFLRDINEVLKERIKINYYMNDNSLLNERLNYSLNSIGERIYYVGNEIIKFDNEKNMRILNENNKFVENEKRNELEESKFNIHTKSESKEQTEIISIPNNLERLNTEFYINAIKYSFDKIYSKESLNNYEEKLVEVFLALCSNSNENEIPLPMFDIYNTYLNYVTESKDYYNDYVKELLKDKEIDSKEKTNTNEKQKKLILDNNGTVDIILVLCGIILVIIIILYFLLVKR